MQPDEYGPPSPFCTDREVFREGSWFRSIVASPDATQVGFTLESDAVIGDRIVGIFSRTTGEVTF